MALHKLTYIVTVVFLISSLMIPAATQQKKGCPDRCGSVRIPYPFGTKDGCYLSTYFSIKCDNSTNPPKAYISNFEISDVEVDGHLSVLHYTAEKCPHHHENSTTSFTWPIYSTNLNSDLPMFVSSKNKFIVVGCSAQASISGYRFGANHEYKISCISRCDRREVVDNKSCSCNGCCSVDLPEKLHHIEISASWIPSINYSIFFSPWPCTYAFIVDGDKFNSSILLNNSIPEKFPIAMDWSVNNQQWSMRKKNSRKQVCKDNAVSYKPDNIPGFRCRCKQGYEGNPYLGCQDIDECKDEGLNDCAHECKNEIGGFICSCPKWYKGDGKINSEGCVFHLSIAIIVAITICGAILAIPSLVVVVWRLFKLVKTRRESMLKKDFFKRNGGLLLEQASGDENQMPTKLFISEELKKATDNYNEDRIVGQGGQGTVYKEMLEDGRLVAIKKSKLINENQIQQFINELVVLYQINHRNVVKLLGCCLETKVPMLVYEYIPNGMLSQQLHDQNEDLPLTWNMRLRIAVEIADALYYLHSAASNPIYHCDIKSSNILMDEKYTAKVADFGIARSIEIDQTHVTTPHIQGTFGYLDPEYYKTGQFTEKSDVYSFGVVLVELLTSEKPISSTAGKYESLANHFVLVMEECSLFDIVDHHVAKEGSQEAIAAFAEVAKRCLNMSGKNRPTMREVAAELEDIRQRQDVTNKKNDMEVAADYGIAELGEVGLTSTMSYGNIDTKDFPTLPRM